MRVNGKLLGGLWLTRDQPWQEPELGLLKQLCSSYAYSLHALSSRPRWWNPHFELPFGRLLAKISIFVLLILVFFIPVHLSVLAPAKISPIDPFIVSSPLKGIIKKVYVQPNQEISKGDPLFSLDDTELRNRHNIAAKALDVIQAEYKNSRQKSLLHADKGSDSELLKAKINSKQAEVDFALEELSFVEVRAARSGIVLFNDVNDLVGKPVLIGERILTLADPIQHEIEIHVPVDNAINLDPGAEVRLFLNVAPSLEITGTIRQTSYEAEITEENILAFLVKARISSAAPLRIGQRGTAKIFGEQVPLYYYVFRRPLAGIRQFLGM
jgi:multidrug efflux pump subunit AcrA (membrane-fusion protein)